MTYRYDEPIRAEDGVLFRIHDHALHSYLFKVDKAALEGLYNASLGKRNPVEPTDRGYPSQHAFAHVQSQQPFDVVDAYNHHREIIHQVAIALIKAGAPGDPIIITAPMLDN
ncbi:MAG TPA: hypothetical protein VFX01_05540 [Methylophilaceae bacterium]|nr:hypothetical protein [Methylophilaceae bacterium]